jgi:parallel beta-helix repeat protein
MRRFSPLLLPALFVTSLVAASSVSPKPFGADAQTEVPVTDNMQISRSTKLKPGVYMLSDRDHDGIIKIVGDNLTVDATGVTVVSADPDFSGYGVVASSRKNITLRNITINKFRYGVRVENSSGIRIENSTITGNYKDTTTCFLAIGDGETYGGGILLRNVSNSVVQGNKLYNQSTGLEMIGGSNNQVLNNQTSLGPAGNESQQNSCWGIRLEGSTDNLIRGNVADYVNRERYPCTCDYCGACRPPATGTSCLAPGDSAGVLLVKGSHRNRVVSNSFTNSGDGFFIGNRFEWASNDNYVYGNDGSYAPANAFEATFSHGNLFENNFASNSNYGFWLGYSYRSRITRNDIISNQTVGIEIEQGYENEIDNNVIWKNQHGVFLRADAPCSDTICDRDHATTFCGRRCPSSDYSIHNNSIVNNLINGLWLAGASFNINAWHNNMLCGMNNADQPCSFAVRNDMIFGRGVLAERNYWGTADPTFIADHIYDGEDYNPKDPKANDYRRGYVNADLPLEGLITNADPARNGTIDAAVGPDVLAWDATAPLPVASSAPFDRRGQQLVFYKNHVYVFGGRVGNQALRNVYYGDLLPDGRVRAWTRTTDLPGAFADHVVVRVGDNVYLLTGAGDATAIYHNRIAAGGALGPAWDLERARLPLRQSNAAASYGEYIYVAGGNSGGVIQNVRYIRVLPDGHLECAETDPVQCWHETSPLPNPMQSHVLVAYDARLYVLATNRAYVPPGYENKIFFVPIKPDGSLGDWAEMEERMPREMDNYAAFATDNKLYLVAGAGTPSVYFAPISSSGALLSWQPTLNLPAAALLTGARVGAYGDFVYTVGGFDGTTEKNTVSVGQLDIPGGCRNGENMTALLKDGLNGARTKLTYTGPATVTVSGTGQADGLNYSDAFYVFADGNGTPSTPYHPTNFVLTINNQPAHSFIRNQQPPGFRHDHRYTFRINAPPGQLTFGVSDDKPSDNKGAYRIGLCGGTP